MTQLYLTRPQTKRNCHFDQRDKSWQDIDLSYWSK